MQTFEYSFDSKFSSVKYHLLNSFSYREIKVFRVFLTLLTNFLKKVLMNKKVKSRLKVDVE